MNKAVTHIDCPKEWEIADDYSSHRPLVWLALNSDKECHPFVELGSGHSTNIFRKHCNENGRKFESYENDRSWIQYTGSAYFEDYSKLELLMGNILFIDGKPGEERSWLTKINKDKYILIIHDTEPSAEYVYGMEPILSTFKYRLDFRPDGFPHTTAVSNFINVTEWV